MEAVTVRKQQDIVREGYFDMTPRSLSEAVQLAELMAKSGMVPTQYRDKPGDVLVAVQMGNEVGLKPLQSLQGIAVINGRPTLWGDAALAVVVNSGLIENYKEMGFEEIEAAGKAVAWFKRRGLQEPIVREFTIDNAKKARLWGKSGPWTDYPYRMLQMRARAFALRDGFADALKGMRITEEEMDVEAAPAPQILAMPRRKSAAAPPPAEAPKNATEMPPQGHQDATEAPTPEPSEVHPAVPACEKCGRATKLIPAGVSKSKIVDGEEKGLKPYGAFWICESDKWSIRDSDWRRKIEAPREPGQDG